MPNAGIVSGGVGDFVQQTDGLAERTLRRLGAAGFGLQHSQVIVRQSQIDAEPRITRMGRIERRLHFDGAIKRPLGFVHLSGSIEARPRLLWHTATRRRA